jgi:hypothetical protein
VNFRMCCSVPLTSIVSKIVPNYIVQLYWTSGSSVHDKIKENLYQEDILDAPYLSMNTFSFEGQHIGVPNSSVYTSVSGIWQSIGGFLMGEICNIRDRQRTTFIDDNNSAALVKCSERPCALAPLFARHISLFSRDYLRSLPFCCMYELSDRLVQATETMGASHRGCRRARRRIRYDMNQTRQYRDEQCDET